MCYSHFSFYFYKSIELLFLRRSHTCILLSPLLAEVELEAERLRSYLQTTEAAIMALNILAVTAMTTYLFVCCFIVYYCILSYPNDSEIAQFVQVTMPNATWSRLRRIFGDKVMKILRHVSDRALVLAYFTIVGGCWSIVFGKLYPWLLFESPTISNLHGVMGVFVFLACFAAWAVANNSHPGKITAQSFRRYDHYPYDHLMFQSNVICQTTKLFKIPRSKFDRIKYNCIVPRYDHMCGWTHNTYGEENYRWFLIFLLNHVIMCFYGTYICYRLFSEEIKMKRLMDLAFFDRLTGETIKANYHIIFQYVFARRSSEVTFMLVTFVMGIALSCFLGYHVYITSRGQTTNENSKWGDIKGWYKKQQQQYRTAVQAGKDTTKQSSKRNNNNNKDVSTDNTTILDEDVVDPGPIPKNIYDRGFVENWKDVFFPLSLRKDAHSRGGYTKESIAKQKQQASQRVENSSTTMRSSSVYTTESSPKNEQSSTTTRCSKPKDV